MVSVVGKEFSLSPLWHWELLGLLLLLLQVIVGIVKKLTFCMFSW